MNKVFNFNVPVLDLARKAFLDDAGKPVNLGSVLAPVLSDHNQGDPLKFLNWATTIFNGEDLTLDQSDQIALKEFITNTLKLNNLVKAQALMVLLK